ncbi:MULTISPECIES: anthranilate synthase component 1 [unclassified Shewanella]|uniref:anthranilate synthase component 1 n=1 Tax=unclassified Shewanella TaxID=196818 RepID=UPI000B344869|nr:MULTISPECIES: anthranilate synthase component 1 [unclassified Shewanella]MDH0448153.1 anthranilate synthase component 1 [Shewanella sp. GD04112]MDH1469879.1 anthranilate synthase component 1 [Shewanella sp. GD03713]QXN23617.1 anthranilate synthase component 1 [Shewanella putrefaciens]VEE63735.1 Anthranilate synthase component 1 [Shewanella putrefaciens]
MTLKTFNQVTQVDGENVASSQQTFARSHTLKAALAYHSDPLRLYQHITQDAPHTMLLESAEIDSKENLKSMVMTHAALMIRCDGYRLRFSALSDNGISLLAPIEQFFTARASQTQCQRDGHNLVVTLQKDTELKDEDARLKSTSPLDGLRLFVKHIDCGAHTDSQSKPAFKDLFLGGVLAYDLIDTVEPLPEAPNGANDCPDYLFYLAETLILIDHKQKHAELITHNFSEGTEKHSVVTQALAERAENIRAQCEALAKNATPAPALVGITATEQVNVSDEDFKQTVIDLKEHIIAGDIFQVVPSRSFSLPCPNTLGAYRALRLTNPSPYMFYFRGHDFTLFGASPESALKYEASNNQVEVYPIAGTRKRGKTASGKIDFDLDSRIELELRLDKKELSEHLMLVDLARNDIARISQSGSRKVAELLKVDRYSHVMHLVSRVTGQLRQDLDALHAYQACMNMGTLVGAPKVRASQLVRQAEKTRRGSYGGAVGYLNALGDMDTCIVIRSAFVKNGVAHIQAGAGVVFDSDPQSEADETRQKAQAVISAIKMGAGLDESHQATATTSTEQQ